MKCGLQVLVTQSERGAACADRWIERFVGRRTRVDKALPRSRRRSHSHVSAGLLRVWLCSVVLGGANATGATRKLLIKSKFNSHCASHEPPAVRAASFYPDSNFDSALRVEDGMHAISGVNVQRRNGEGT
jgi:hypothetical protein